MFVDLIGDRHFVIDPMAPNFGPFAIPFAMEGSAYAVTRVDPAGRTLTLRSDGPSTPQLRPEVGSPAPIFSCFDTHGNMVRMSDYRGRVAIVYFWASWCSGCKRQADELSALYRQYDRQHLEIIGINFDTERADADQFQSAHGQIWPMHFAGPLPAQDPVARMYGESGAGVFYVVDVNGRLVSKEFTVEGLKRRIESLLPGDQVGIKGRG